MGIGSRPASRRSGGGVENLRAIPWVFSWAQCRIGLPAAFGMGTALAAVRKELGFETLRAMNHGWLFFSSMLSDVEMALAKSDLDIGRHYRLLAPSPSQAIFELIDTELRLARSMILSIKEQGELLDSEPTLQDPSVYVTPM